METTKKGIKSFRDLNIWQDAIVLVKDIYDAAKTFPNSEMYIALGSLAALETQVIIANELGYIDRANREAVVQRIDIFGKQIRSLVSILTPNPRSPASKK